MNKIKEINDLNNLIHIKKQTIEEMNIKIEQLEKEINQIKTNLGILNNNTTFDFDKINKDTTLFNGIDEIIQEINDNKNENEIKIDDVGISDGDERDKNKVEGQGKERRNKESFADFVLSLNNNLNINTKEKKDRNNKYFGIESLTKRKPFGDFNFE
jgi:hypothetical protein